MADDVQIKFGADIGAALAGIASFKQAIAGIKEPIAELKSALAGSDAPFAAAERAKIQEARGDWAQILGIYQDWLDHTRQIYGESSQQYQQVLRDQIAATQAAAAQMARDFEKIGPSDDSAIKEKKADLADEAAAYKETKQQELQALLDFVDQSGAAEIAQYQQFLTTVEQYPEVYRQVYDQMLTRIEAFSAQVASINRQITQTARAEAQKQQAQWTELANQMGSSMQRTFNEIVEGQTTWQKGGIKLIGDFENFFLESVEKMAAKWAASGLASLAGGAVSGAVSGAQATGASGLGAGLMALIGMGQPGGLFGTGLASSAASATQTTATAAQTTAVTASTTALTTMATATATATTALSTLAAAAGTAGASSAAGGATSLASGAAAAGGAAASGGGFFSGILSSVGSLFAFAGGGIVPSAAGGWALPNFSGATPALLHAREMVLPADISQGLQGMIQGGGRGGGDTHVHIHAIDSRSGAQFVMSQAHTIARALQRAQRSFNPAAMAR